MKSLRLPAAAPSRQMNFLFDNRRLEGVASAERDKIISVLAQILMQAAGLSVEELEDNYGICLSARRRFNAAWQTTELSPSLRPKVMRVLQGHRVCGCRSRCSAREYQTLSAMTLDQLGAKMRCDKCGKRPERYYPANQNETPGLVRS